MGDLILPPNTNEERHARAVERVASGAEKRRLGKLHPTGLCSLSPPTQG